MSVSQARTDALAALSAADTDDLIEAAGAEIAVKCWGQGRPVVCLHDVGHGSRDFGALSARLQDDFELIALDWPGHGRSPPEARAPSVDRHAEILIEAMDALHLEHPVLMGAGLGGSAALVAAARRPDLFSGLVLCNAPGLTPLTRLERFASERMAGLMRRAERRDWRYPVIATAVLGRAPPRAAAPLLAHRYDMIAEPDLDLRPLAERVRAPVWLAWANGDRLIPRRTGVTRLFRKACATNFAGRRAPFLGRPDAFADAFRRLAEENL